PRASWSASWAVGCGFAGFSLEYVCRPCRTVRTVRLPPSHDGAPTMIAQALRTVLARQRRPLLVAVLLCVAALWITIPLDRTQVGVFFSVGIWLSLLNHVLTEVGLYRAIESGGEISRKQFAMGSLGRLAVVTLIAFAIVLAFWPYG